MTPSFLTLSCTLFDAGNLNQPSSRGEERKGGKGKKIPSSFVNFRFEKERKARYLPPTSFPPFLGEKKKKRKEKKKKGNERQKDEVGRKEPHHSMLPLFFLGKEKKRGGGGGKNSVSSKWAFIHLTEKKEGEGQEKGGGEGDDGLFRGKKKGRKRRGENGAH